jgi:predicted metal-binding membrane protein
MDKLRLLGIVVVCALALLLAQAVARDRVQADGRLTTSDGDTVDISDSARAGGLTFAADVAPADRGWILAAIARARPEAARLIAEVDGLVRVATFADGGATLGVTRSGPRGFTIDLDTARLDNDRVMDRTTVVLHELGHVVDFALVPAAVGVALDEQIPRGGSCGLAIDCDRPQERFADTFAKWALNGAVAEIGAGYGIAMPASIEDWGAPLAQIAFKLPRR